MHMCDAYDIIIEGGQSNAEGSGVGPVDAFEEFKPSSNILYLTPDCKVTVDEKGVNVEYPSDVLTVKIAEERVRNGNVYGDLALTFANDYIKNGMLGGNRKLLIVRGAIGGTSFFCKHWSVNGILYSKMIEMVDYVMGLNPENKVVGFLWHQGEADAKHICCEDYQKHLDDMLSDVRKRYGEMPFITGNFVQEWIAARGEICEKLVNIYRKFVSKKRKTAFVESDGLLSNNQKVGNGDIIHFCRESLYELGHRYYNAFAKIIK